MVITKEPLTEYLPIQRKPEPGQDPEDAPVVTQYEMHGVEDLGLLKMDFLGLRNLDVHHRHRRADPHARVASTSTSTTSPLDDAPDLRAAAAGDSIGVFQLEGGPMRALMRSLAPTTFEDVAALVALYRPGPMAANMHNDYADRKNGRKPIEYLHPDAEEVLGDTYGLMIYQESVMRVAQKFAGYSLAEADNLRQGLRQEDPLEDEARSARSSSTGARPRATARELGNQWFDIIEPFADYAFPKATLRLRPHRLPDRLPQGELPGRVLRRAADQRQGQPRQGRGLPRRVPRDGHRGARARRQPVRRRDFTPVPRRRRRRQVAARSRSGCRRCATSAKASSR